MTSTPRPRPRLRALLATAGLAIGLTIAPNVAEPASAADPPGPTFQVDPRGSIWVNDFTPNGSITITIDTVDHGPYTLDEWGNFDSNNNGLNFNVAAGSAVTVTDGTTTKDHTVTNLTVTSVDADTNIVSGTAAASSELYVNLHSGPWEASRTVTADGAGVWSTDFDDPGDEAATHDLQPGDNGAANQCDTDEDCTQFHWNVPNPNFQVDPAYGSIWVNEFTPNGSITITIDTVDYGPYTLDEWGNFDSNNNGLQFTFGPASLVSVADGTTTKNHTVTNLTVTGINTDLDQVYGTAAPDAQIHVWTHNGGGNVNVTADSNGDWTADFTGQVDLEPGSNGAARECDGDGDCTQFNWNVPNPNFQVDPAYGSIWVNEFTPNGSITITIDTVDYGPYTLDEWGNFDSNNNGLQFTFGPASLVSVADGTTTKNHTVTNLTVTGINTDLDQVYGTAAPDAQIHVWTHNGGGNVNVTADGNGDWTADFTGQVDLEPGSNGAARECDGDDDCTQFNWNVPNPNFQVDPAYGSIWVNEFTPNGSITITIDTVGYGPYTLDEWGNFDSPNNGLNFDVPASSYVTVTDGTTTKNHTVTNLTVTGINTDLDQVYGTAAPGAQIHVWTHNGGGNVDVTADGNGDWTANFAAMADLVTGSNGAARECDGDGDCTQFNWNVPNPNFQVDPAYGSIWVNEFTPDGSITITIDGTGYGPYTLDEWGNFDSPNNGLNFDVPASSYVTVTDGTTTKNHTVTNLTVTGINTDLDQVYGTAAPGAQIHVWTHNSGGNVNVTADGNGDWTADFTGQVDLITGSDGAAQECDNDGDCTQPYWNVANPTITASVSHDEIWAEGWPSDPDGQLLHWRLDDPATPEIDHQGDMPLLVTPWGTEAGDRSFGTYDVQAGQVLTVRNRSFDEPLGDGMERQLDVSRIVVTDVDAISDLISGFADAAEGDRVCVWSNEAVLCSGEEGFTWNPDGTLVADFGSVGSDVRPGHWNEASQYDDDGDRTHFWWNLPPWVVVNLAPEDETGTPRWPDEVRAESWVGPTVTLTINGAFVADIDVSGNEHDQTTIALPDFDIEPGDVVILDDGTDTKTLVVEALGIDHVNFSTDIPPNTIQGTASLERDVRVEISASVGGRWAERHVQPDSGGTFLADFGNPGNGWREQWTAELGGPQGLGRHVRLEIYDDDNDRTESRHCEGVPRIEVSRFDNQITVYDYPEGTVVTIEIYDPADPGTPAYTATGIATPNPENPCETIIVFDVVDYEIPEQASFEASDGTPEGTVTHTPIPFTLDLVDQDADRIHGTTAPGLEVQVEANGPNGQFWRYVIADEFGDWVADFSIVPVDPEPGENGTVDIGPGSNGQAIVLDEFGNSTVLTWYIASAHFHVDPAQGSLRANEFEPGGSITIDVAGTGYGPFGLDEWGNFDGNNVGLVLDVTAGQEVTVSDGTTIKDHTVTSLAINDVDPETDTITGTAAAGSALSIWVHDNGAQLDLVADAGGGWTADFSALADLVPGSNGNSSQCDDDNDCTQVGWGIPNAHFQVDPLAGSLWANEFEPGGFITIDVAGTGYGPFGLDGSGNFDTNNVGLVLDVTAGQVVTVSDGTTIKDHTVTSLTITGVDPDADTISGTADPGAYIQVLAGGSGFDWRSATADEFGNWTVEFGVPHEFGPPRDLQPGDHGFAEQADDDFDATTAQWGIPNAHFQVDPTQGSIWANEFEPNTGLTISIGGVGVGSWTTDEWGNFDGNQYGVTFDVASGDVVEVTDETTTKSHTVTNLTITAVDPLSDTITGTAAAGSTVSVWVHNTQAYLDVQADGSGNWTADFSGMADLVPGSNGNSNQCDDDGDCTTAYWWLANANFQVDPGQGSIWANEFEPNTDLTISIGGVGVGSWTTDEWGNFDGNQYGVTFDVAPSDVVEVTDGTTTKSHTVTNLTITAVDPLSDTITGTAAVGSTVSVWVHNTQAYLDVQADGSGNWTADFSGMADLVAGSNGNSNQCDDDGDCTMAYWHITNPSFTVRTGERVIRGWEWGESTEVFLTIDDPSNGPGVDYSASAFTGPAEWNGDEIVVEFRPWDDGFEVLAGFEVTMSDGVITKYHEVRPAYEIVVDPDADTVSGYATPVWSVHVHIHETDVSVDVGTEPDGSFIADFSGMWDIQPGTYGEVYDHDSDGDATQVEWSLPQDPYFIVYPDEDRINGEFWHGDGPLTITVDEDENPLNGVLYQTTPDYDPGEGWIDLYVSEEFDLQPGQYVVVTDGVNTKAHWVTGVAVTVIDPDADTVSGTAEPYSEVVVEIDGSLEGYVFEHVVFNLRPGGNALLQDQRFRDAIAYAINRQVLVDNVDGADAVAYSFMDVFFPDQGWNAWAMYGYYPDQAAALVADICADPVLGLDCSTDPLAITLTTTVGDLRTQTTDLLTGMLADVGIVLTVEQQDAGVYFDDTAPNGLFELGEWAFGGSDLEGLRGFLAFLDPEERWEQNWYGYPTDFDTGPDTLADLIGQLYASDDVAGLETVIQSIEQLLADEMLFVPIYFRSFDTGEMPAIVVEADGGGNWVADFSGMFDIEPGTTGRAIQPDEDGDATQVEFRLPGDPEFGVTATHDWIEFIDYGEGAIHVTFADAEGGSVLYELDFEEAPGIHVIDDFDVEAGQFVTVTQGDFVKTLWVSPIEVTDVDRDNWVVYGVADPNVEIDTFAVTPYGSFGEHMVQVNEFGDWSLDLKEMFEWRDDDGDGVPDEPLPEFGLLLGGGQRDDDSDRTIMFWDPAVVEGYVYVNDDPAQPVAGAEVFLQNAVGSNHTCTDENGYYRFDNASLVLQLVRPGIVATGRAVNPDAAGPGVACSNADFLAPDNGQPLIIGLHTENFDLWDGSEQIDFYVDRAGAYHDVVVEELVGTDWVLADGIQVRAFDVGVIGNPDPANYRDVFYGEDGQVALDFTGVYLLEEPGTVELRYPEVTDLLVIVEYIDGSYIGQYNPADGFVDDGTGVFVGPTLTFPAAPVITYLDVTSDPVPIGTTVDLMAGFTDPDMPDSHDAEIDWGDGSIPTEIINAPWDFEAAHIYDEPGVYTVAVTVTDDYGHATTEQYQFVVVYDPDGGFVTGGGWIDSPAGAYTPDPELMGRANFGFVAKYKKGKITPDGNTNFQFQTAGLHFQSTAYDWLVISGEEKAKYKGVGTINGEGDYGFMLTAMDREEGDTFRIKIWDNATGETVYDNWSIDGDDSYDGTALGGGSIVIHTAKK